MSQDWDAAREAWGAMDVSEETKEAVEMVFDVIIEILQGMKDALR